MSSLLKEAIVDAKALREAALKNAEDAVINKYSNEVRKTLNTLLEQEDILGDTDLDLDSDAEPDMSMGPEKPSMALDDSFIDDIDEVPYAAENGLSSLKGSRNLDNSLADDDLSTITLDLGALSEHVQKLNEQKEEVIEVEDDEDKEVMKEEEEVDDEVEVEEEPVEKSLNLDSLTDAIVEKLTVDMGADLSGWAGRSSDDMKYQMEKEMAHRRTTEVQEELEILKKAQEELVFENKKLTRELSKYRTAIGEMKESINDINLSNARLLYTNRVLRNTSLNERQKEQIVEAISKSDSVNEARTIYNTLQSTVKSTPSRGPRSLSEAINRPSSLIRATRKESKEPNDVFAERMKKLAGIK
tara:strand:+ start:1191 stop:2264 length:1074 start_codon:yes stop_codon:yes gene_type:complete